SFVVTAPRTSFAGNGFAVTITAKDAYGNTVTTYSGGVTFTSSDGQTITLPATSLTWADGSTTAILALNHAGSPTLTASAGSVKGTTGPISITNTIVVTTASDSAGHAGTSLRDAVVLANAAAAAGADVTISFNPAQMGSKTITLAQGPLRLRGVGK